MALLDEYFERPALVDLAFGRGQAADQPGVAVALLEHGRVRYWRGFGSTRVGRRDALGPRSVFNLASLSKQFTAFCVLLAQEQGSLSVQDRLRTWLPEFGPRFEGILLHHLMHHSSGLPCLMSTLYSQEMAGRWRPGGPAHLRLLARQDELNFPPGWDFSYCNDGYLLLAEILRRATGRTLGRFAQEELFDPLGMRRTRFRESSKDRLDGWTWGHIRVDGGWRRVKREDCVAGPGDLWSCLEDLAIWERHVQDRRVGSKALHRAWIRPGATRILALPGGGYAGGLIRYRANGVDYVGHDGDAFGHSCFTIRAPKSGRSVICLFNHEYDVRVSKTFQRLHGSTKPGAAGTRQGSGPPRTRQDLGGFYSGVDHLAWVELTQRGPGLSLNDGSRTLLLVADGRGRYRAPASLAGLDYRFQIKNGAQPRLLLLRQGRIVRTLERVARIRTDGPPAGADGYYRHIRGGWTWRLFTTKGALHLHCLEEPGPPFPLRPLGRDRYAGKGGGWYLRLERDARGVVTACTGINPAGRFKRCRLERLAKKPVAGYRVPRQRAAWRMGPAHYAIDDADLSKVVPSHPRRP